MEWSFYNDAHGRAILSAEVGIPSSSAQFFQRESPAAATRRYETRIESDAEERSEVLPVPADATARYRDFASILRGGMTAKAALSRARDNDD
jgi:hypothetical protein